MDPQSEVSSLDEDSIVDLEMVELAIKDSNVDILNLEIQDHRGAVLP